MRDRFVPHDGVGMTEMEKKDPHRSAPFLQCLHVHKSCEQGKEVLHDLSLQVCRGDFVFLTGPNGSGKTTLLNCVLGIEKISQGHILFEGVNLQELTPGQLSDIRLRMGLISQDFKLLGYRSVYENAVMPLRAAGKSNAFILKRIVQVLRFVGLQNKMDTPCRELSAGEQMQAAIARAVANGPPILLADEPTANLDENAAGNVMSILEEIHLRGATVLLTTHNPSLPLLIPESRIVEIRQGAACERSNPKRSFLSIVR
jgi:cell division transport system ATP-binding protein